MIEDPYRSPQADSKVEIDEEIAAVIQRRRRERRRLDSWSLLIGVGAIVIGISCAFLARLVHASGLPDWIFSLVTIACFAFSISGGMVLACGSLVVSWLRRIRTYASGPGT